MQGGVQLGPLGTSATDWPTVPAPGYYGNGEFGGMKIGRGNRNTRRKPTPAPLCPPQIPLDQTRIWTRAAAVGSRRPAAWAMARPSSLPLVFIVFSSSFFFVPCFLFRSFSFKQSCFWLRLFLILHSLLWKCLDSTSNWISTASFDLLYFSLFTAILSLGAAYPGLLTASLHKIQNSSTYLPLYLSYLHNSLSTYLPTNRPTSTYLRACLHIYLYICLPACLSVYLLLFVLLLLRWD
jgi:hypothetical protein